METQENLNQETGSLTPIRATEIDIIKGASNTDQIEAMQANAAQNPQDQTLSKPATILAVNNGTPGQDGQLSPSEDLDNPATRGI